MEEYERFYFSKNTTLSAVKLGDMAETRVAWCPISRRRSTPLIPSDDSLQPAYTKAVRENRRTFEDQEYLDLLVLTKGILDRYDRRRRTLRAARRNAIICKAPDGPVQGPMLPPAARSESATGISIYVPYDMPSPLYARDRLRQCRLADLSENRLRKRVKTGSHQ